MAPVTGSTVEPMDEDSDTSQPRPTLNVSDEGRLPGADPTLKMRLAPSAIVHQAAAEALDQRCAPCHMRSQKAQPDRLTCRWCRMEQGTPKRSKACCGHSGRR